MFNDGIGVERGFRHSSREGDGDSIVKRVGQKRRHSREGGVVIVEELVTS